MILDSVVTLQISPTNIHHWKSWGYHLGFGEYLVANVNQLPPKARTEVLCGCDRCGYQWRQRFAIAKRACENNLHLCRPCMRKHIGKTMNKTNITRLAKNRVGPLNTNWNEETPAYRRYRTRVKKLSEEEYKKYIDWINPNRLPRTLSGVSGGYQLDHKLPIRVAFTLGLAPELVSRFHNLQMLRWEANASKGCRINTLKRN